MEVRVKIDTLGTLLRRWPRGDRDTRRHSRPRRRAGPVRLFSGLSGLDRLELRRRVSLERSSAGSHGPSRDQLPRKDARVIVLGERQLRNQEPGKPAVFWCIG